LTNLPNLLKFKLNALRKECLMKPLQDNLWWDALDHLERSNPQLLADLLKKNALHSHLDDLVEQAKSQLGNLLGQGLQLPEAQEYVLEVWAPPGPDSPEPLDRKGQQLLADFRQTADQEVEKLPT